MKKILLKIGLFFKKPVIQVVFPYDFHQKFSSR
jgi:hypothetical protein